MAGLSTTEVVNLALAKAGSESLSVDGVVLVDAPKISKVLLALEVGTAELLLARELGCDGVIVHHPPGGDALLHAPEGLFRHVDLMRRAGISRKAARRAIANLVSESTLQTHASNFQQVPAVARALRVALICLHLPLEEIGRKIMHKAISSHVERQRGLPRVADAITALCTIPEFACLGTRIMVPAGAVDNPLGRFAVVYGAGASANYSIVRCYFDHNVRTVICSEIDAESANWLRDERSGNLIIAGHVATDMIGINVVGRALEETGVEVVRLFDC